MLKKLEVFKFGLFLAFLFIGSGLCFGQGLGSSSGLFGSSNKSKPSTTTKKTPVKKAATTKPKPTRAQTQRNSTRTNNSNTRTRSTNRNTRRPTIASNTQRTRNTTTNQTNSVQTTTVITVGNSTETYNENLENALEEGNAARDARDYFKAESAYRRAQLMKADDSRAVYGLGNVFSDQQRWEEAEKFYRQAIQIEKDNADAYVALSYVLSQPVSADNLSERYMEAEKMARSAIQLDAQNPFAYDQLGVALEQQALINAETETAYRKAIQIDSRFALAYAHLGRLLRKKGQINASNDAYRQAIQFSTDVPTMIQVAEVMQTQQRYVESEQLLRRALEKDTKNPTALFLLGRALTTKGSPESYAEAEKVLKKGLVVSPNNFVAYTLLASLYARQNNFTEAERSLYKALQIASVNEKRRLAQDFEMVGDGLMKIGKKADAARLYKQAVALDAKKTSLAEKLAKAQS